MNSKEIRGLLANRYQAPTYAFFEEVSNGTGAYHSNYADAVACGLWPSAGLETEGFEIKSVRGDWLNELKNPQKASAVFQYCHRWWLVAEKGVAKLDEIPAPWGFYEVVNGKFFKRKPAPLLTPAPMPPHFIASLLRRATENVTPNSAIHKIRQDEYKRGQESKEEEVKRAQSELKKYEEKVSVFEQASGIDILHTWTGGKEIGAAVKFVLDGGFRIEYNVSGAIDDAKRALASLNRLKNVVEKFVPPKDV